MCTKPQPLRPFAGFSLKLIPALALVVPLSLVGPAYYGLALEAIPSYQWSGRQIAGFAKGGAGFAFFSQRNLLVLSLGFGGGSITNEPYQVCLWDTNGLELACAIITTNSQLRNATWYEPIPLLSLDPGQTFYISAAGVDSGVWSGDTLLSSGLGQNGTFSVAPGIGYLGSATSTNSAGVFPLTVGPTYALPVGANFEYITGPLITLSGLTLTNDQAQVGFNLIGATPPSLILLEAEQPGGPWFTNLNATLMTNLPGAVYSFTLPQEGQARFFRVLAP